MDRINIKGKPRHKPNDDVALSTVATMGQVPLTSQGAGLWSWSTCLWTFSCVVSMSSFLSSDPCKYLHVSATDSPLLTQLMNWNVWTSSLLFFMSVSLRWCMPELHREKTSDLHFYARLSSVMRMLKLEYLFACQHLFNSDSRVVFYTQLLNADFWSQLWVMNMQRQILFERSF